MGFVFHLGYCMGTLISGSSRMKERGGTMTAVVLTMFGTLMRAILSNQ